MATAHRRINVTCDPELAAAMDATRGRLGEMPDSARVRALALAGARALLEGTDEEEERARREFLSRLDVAVPAANRNRSWLKDVKSGPGREGTEALEWVRGPR